MRFGTDTLMTFLTLREVADELHVSEKTVLRYVQHQMLPVYNVGVGTVKQQMRVKQEDLDCFLEARLMNQPEPAVTKPTRARKPSATRSRKNMSPEELRARLMEAAKA